jgi:replicative DNA helicase
VAPVLALAAPPAAQLPDHDLAAESAVVGGVLLEPAVLAEIDWLPTEALYSGPHRLVLGACRQLREEAPGAGFDAVRIAGYLRDQGRLADVGGVPGIARLLDACPSVHDVQTYARRVSECHQIRRLDYLGRELTTKTRGTVGDRPAVLAWAESELGKIREAGPPGPSKAVAIGTAAETLIARLRSPETGAAKTFTGLRDLDRALAGLEPGDLWYLAARPGQGKTSLAVNIACNLALAATRGGPQQGAMLFSLEMPTDQIAQRVICAEAHVDLAQLRRGQLTPEEWDAFDAAQAQLKSYPFSVDDTSGLTVAEITTRARAQSAEWAKKGIRLALVVVDYLQLVRGRAGKKYPTREAEVAEISKDLKALGKVLGCPVLALAQLSRACEKESRTPRPSDIRDSGQAEQDADIITFLHRDKETPKGATDVHIAKQRQGEPGKIISLAWWGKFCRFSDLAPQAPKGPAKAVWPRTAE